MQDGVERLAAGRRTADERRATAEGGSARGDGRRWARAGSGIGIGGLAASGRAFPLISNVIFTTSAYGLTATASKSAVIAAPARRTGGGWGHRRPVSGATGAGPRASA